MSPFTSSGWALPLRGVPCPSFSPFPLLQATVDEAVNNLRAPAPLIWSSALSALSVAIQGLVDVRKPTGQVVPTSLMLATVADSGERKSSVEDAFMAAIRDFQHKHAQAHQQAMADWQLAQDIWLARRKMLLRDLAKDAANTESSAELRAHEQAKPAPPRQRKWLYEDSTSEALFYGLSQGGGSAGLISSEGRAILNGRAFGDMEKMNAIWSGSPIAVDRKSGDSFLLQGARLTVSFQAQGSVMQAYMNRCGQQALGSGLLARFLVCMPASTQGTRFIQNGTLSWECSRRFAQRLTALLERNTFEGSPPEKIVMQFSSEAAQQWLVFFNAIEAEIRPGGRFEGAGGHASKLAENVARMAALTHFFEEGEGDISVATLRFAISYCLYCSDEFLRLFMPPPQEQLDAGELWGWLANLYNSGRRYVAKNHVRQFCLNKLRRKGRLDAALEVLRFRGCIGFVSVGRTLALDLQPCLPADQQRAYLEVPPSKRGDTL